MSHLDKYSCQSISQDDVEAVLTVLNSDFLTQGPKTHEFEDQISRYVDSKYACSVNSATSGLHVALLALGIGPGDSVWTTPNTFVATVNAAIYCGATVRLIDIDLETLNIDIDLLSIELEEAHRKGTLPKAIIPVHFGGCSVDMTKIDLLREKYGFFVVEDASHALGAKVGQEKTGSCKWSDATVFSFHPVKPITCGEGGVVTCNSIDMLESMKRLRSHGIDRSNREQSETLPYQQIEIGYNYRLSDIHAALGLSQLKRSDSFLEKRAKLRSIYEEYLCDSPISFQKSVKNGRSSQHLLAVQFDSKPVRDQVKMRMISEGIGINFHYTPVYRHSFHKGLGNHNEFPKMEAYFSTGLTLPLHVKLLEEEVIHVCKLIKEELA